LWEIVSNLCSDALFQKNVILFLFKYPNLIFKHVLTNYNPPRSEESPAGFAALLQQVSAANMEEAQARQLYNTSVVARENAFRKKEGSLIKLLPPIRAQVLAQYGKNSAEFKQTDAQIANIRDTRIIVKKATETTPEKTMSQSEQSFGSLTQYFSNLVSNLVQLPGYNPSNAMIQVSTLQNFLVQIGQLNIEVAARSQQLYKVQNRRRALYEELHDRAQRIKNYTKANYGIKGLEYTLIKSLRI
jgi:hypothetical protein